MLRLKRRTPNTVSISLHKRTWTTKKYLFRGFIFAIFFHVAILFFFQIRVQYVDENISLNPIPIVYLDPEEVSLSTFAEDVSSSEDFGSKLTKELHLLQTPFFYELEEVPAIDFSPKEPEKPSSITLLPWPLSDTLSPSQYTVRAYPIKVVLRDKLRKLFFINDGSQLFKKASYESLFVTPFFAESQPRVHFHVEVSLTTGAITKMTCSRELVDKRLQEVAVRLLTAFRFASTRLPGNETACGEIILQFCGTFDRIEPLLATGYNND